MTLNLYVMPLAGTGTKASPRRPKYVTDWAGFDWGMYDYGNEPWCLVGVLNVTAGVNTTITGETQVSAIPTTLSNTVGGSASTVDSDLEAVNMPGTWVTSTNTWRDVVLFVGACCQIAQRFQGNCGGQWFTGGVTLNTTIGSLPTNTQSCLISTVQSFGISTTQFASSNTLRQAIQSAAQQYVSGSMPLLLAGVSLYTA